MKQVTEVKEYYLCTGYDPLPIRAGTKIPIAKGWSYRSPTEQWSSIQNETNIGLRCGGRKSLCVIDADDKKKPTSNLIRSYLASLGFQYGMYPEVRTPSGGYHFYFSSPSSYEQNIFLLKEDFGAGELRFGQGAYVVAPPSSLQNGIYKLVNGDFKNLPYIEFSDLLNLVRDPLILHDPQTENRIPRNAYNLFNGIGIENYKSRSEAEMAIMFSFANANTPFNIVLKNFTQYSFPGKFYENYQKNSYQATAKLKSEYQKATRFCKRKNSENYNLILELINQISAQIINGNSKSTDRSVLLAHLRIALRIGKTTYSASIRSIAELSGVSDKTALVATKRLEKYGYIRLVKNWVANKSNIYQIQVHNFNTSSQVLEDMHTKCDTLSEDLFRYQGMGKSGFFVYHSLLIAQLSVKELSKSLHLHRSTISRVLQKLRMIYDFSSQNPIPMVEKSGMKWKANPINITDAAKLIQCDGIKERQFRKHQAERRLHRLSLTRGRSRDEANLGK